MDSDVQHPKLWCLGYFLYMNEQVKCRRIMSKANDWNDRNKREKSIVTGNGPCNYVIFRSLVSIKIERDWEIGQCRDLFSLRMKANPEPKTTDTTKKVITFIMY